ncbi:putative lipase/esterase LipN [Iodidimonas gelatinilytica]|uniref:Putative lipase/esterase LipN n=1 Tax=Iodidimonas gelatinilytica TaxID=1236966 RepID=A0A5A7MUY3_9PROT|nr:alpha/beta hydrolase [Iodidimonas gelatinilytica]GEQ99133.1 putative lipase/esterase LipN [Iodidimonas gelatinilytica]GER01996.1 putative lipase/esterase LipN [Iodidimonas gelatinilytica]
MTLDEDAAAFLREMNAAAADAPSFAELGIIAAREMSQALFTGFVPSTEPACHSENLTLEGRDSLIGARFYRPANPVASERAIPLVMFFHGGGWAMGDLDSYHELVSDLCDRSGIALLSVDYRLAPEHPFPAGLHDCIDSLYWVVRHAASLGVDPTRLGVMGDSAGGNLAAVVAHQLHGGGELAIKAQYLIYPMLDISRPHESYPSRMDWGGGGYLLDLGAIDTTANWYVPDHSIRRDDPAISPLFIEDVSGLPPTFLIAAGHDPLRSENETFVARLKDAGVKTRYRCFKGAIHAFLSFPQFTAAQTARSWLGEAMAQLAGD